MKKYEGQCACGNIEYVFEDEPTNLAFCYCHDCQIHTGSDKWFGLWVPKDKFSIVKGKPSVFTRLGDSGQALHHQFCHDCGVTLCIEVTVAGFYSVAASTVKGNSVFSPNMAIYTASAPQWAVFPENIPKFDKLPPSTDD